jgi:hypothetical protein
MTANRFLYTAVLIPGIYIFLTAVWGLVEISSFMVVTGPKTDIWLVRTVSICLLPYSFICFFIYYNPKKLSKLLLLCMITMGIGLIYIDIYYYELKVIKWVYLIDAFFQVFFLMIWFSLICQTSKAKSHFVLKYK